MSQIRTWLDGKKTHLTLWGGAVMYTIAYALGEKFLGFQPPTQNDLVLVWWAAVAGSFLRQGVTKAADPNRRA